MHRVYDLDTMHLLGLSFILYLLKLSAGNGLCSGKNANIFSCKSHLVLVEKK